MSRYRVQHSCKWSSMLVCMYDTIWHLHIRFNLHTQSFIAQTALHSFVSWRTETPPASHKLPSFAISRRWQVLPNGRPRSNRTPLQSPSRRPRQGGFNQAWGPRGRTTCQELRGSSRVSACSTTRKQRCPWYCRNARELRNPSRFISGPVSACAALYATSHEQVRLDVRPAAHTLSKSPVFSIFCGARSRHVQLTIRTDRRFSSQLSASAVLADARELSP